MVVTVRVRVPGTSGRGRSSASAFGLVVAFFAELGGLARLAGSTLRNLFRPPFEISLWLDQLHDLGVRSLTLTNVTLLFTGMVLAVQTAYSLAAYGGKTFIGDILALSVVLELGPVLTALMVSGRVGAGITAELGSMAVTEQVDALRALAADPVRKLVVPRVGALVLALPMLTVMAIVVALFGGMLMAVLEAGQTTGFFVNHVVYALTVEDIARGILKAPAFAFFIGVIACRNGLTATGGADGVGKATTRTVVVSSIAVIVSDFFLTKLLYVIWP